MIKKEIIRVFLQRKLEFYKSIKYKNFLFVIGRPMSFIEQKL